MKPLPHRILVAATLCLAVLPAGAADLVVEKPLPPLEAARTMRVPRGFHVTLFAGEPDIMQPIGFCIDDRGRLWVAEAYNYPDHGTRPGDRIVILEDTNHDGRFDKRTVFHDQLNYVTGIEVGFGGAWVMSPPYFYFIPDRNGDLIPDAEPEVLLDGFGNHANSHNLANGFSWGPDGWLYGTHGRTNWSRPAKRGTPDADRPRYDGGVWRYHPVRHVWEPFADGTTNPWGIDWDDYGQGFVCNCVNPHLFHVIQGAHYEPWRNYESSRYAYERIATIADHLHYLGGNDVRAGIGSEAELAIGGGHAHSGTMVYLGDNFPASYRNGIFMNNIHGHRLNHDVPRRAGSGYTASHAPDLLVARDQWFMGVTVRYGPDGGVFVSDWSDTGECHSVRNTRKTTGRIFKITYGRPRPFTRNLHALPDAELVKLQLHPNDWLVQHARRLLHERAAAGRDLSAANLALRELFAGNPDVTRKLRALWALHVIGATDDPFLTAQLNHPSEHVRAWAVQLLCEDREPPAPARERFARLAAEDASPFVRLYLASALQRLPADQRWPIAGALLAHAGDATDQNLPQMNWYAIEPLVHADLNRFVSLALRAQIPLVRNHIARRAASLPEAAGINAVAALLGQTGDAAARKDLLTGALAGLEGRREVPAPPGWSALYARLNAAADPALREQATQLALLFNDPAALASLRATAADSSAAQAVRNRALEALVGKRVPDLAPLLLRLVEDPVTRRAAIRGLAAFNHPDTAATLLQLHAIFDAVTRQDALQTLASRAAWAVALLDAVERGRVPRAELTAFTARQMQSLGDPKLAARVKSLWGELRESSGEKLKLINAFKKKLDAKSLARADAAAGRATFQLLCGVCHKLFTDGNAVGPELTGAQRTNLDYLLENILDPSASVARDYQMQIIDTTDGRTITGFLVAETEVTLTVRTVNEQIVLPRTEIRRLQQTSASIMPEGLLQALSTQQLRDLFAFLMSSGP